MGVRADILEVSRVLAEASRSRDLSRFEPQGPLGADAKVYASLMRALPRNRDIPGALKGADLRPLFLVNGLILAASLRRPARTILLEALAAGLLEFSDYFELIADRRAAPTLPREQARALQARYFAYCAAQLVECGLPVSGALATMKGDACDEETGLEIQAWIEDGPSAMLGSALLPARERELWQAVFSQGRSAWPALRAHLVETYSLPFRPLLGR